jgi:hypothetical protein
VQLQFKGQCLRVTIKKVMVLVDSLFICKLIFFLVPLHDVKGEVREKAKIVGILLVPGIGDPLEKFEASGIHC